LKNRGVEFIGPDEGMLSCGYEGLGRLWPVEKIVERALKLVR
jgi:phosphopantothenoylcysteine decarboxylase